jgi:GTP-sensing pleiotropic transcriptional regulator CodY
MLENLHEIMDGALKIGNRPLYIQSGKLAEVVGEWHKITTEMSEDQKLMIQFMAMTKTFYRGVIEYRDVVQDFSRTIRDFNSLKKFGLSIPRQIQTSSAEAARSFQELVNSIASIDVGYTRLTDYVLLKDKDEERLSKQFEEGRRRLSEKQ